ncbi:MAG: undecaprenyldiphospho-muramoylpentapeptide beta-N-acetylglucosaminyltransferase [Spirochaetes bacterium]|nr:undecaprenyldiphospho-muramoylpentapeptide beta-N-acetylglucosaminyltransferase [Spirochaetota bacterium]
MKKTVLISGGGTGGHIMPGIALYEEFASQGYTPVLLVGNGDIKFSSLKSIENVQTYNAPTMWKNIFNLPAFTLQFVSALLWTMRFITKNNVAAVIGMGGYVSAPSLVAALFKKIPIYLCEQNVVPGMVTNMFAKKAQAIFTTFEATAEFLDIEIAHTIIHSGNPIRKHVVQQVEKEVALKRFNMMHCKKVILVIGGSQGALKLNELMFDMITQYPENFADIGIIWSTGTYSYEQFKEKLQNVKHHASIFLAPYILDVENSYAACDIAISRAGAGVMMELAAWGIPSILIPYPYAAKDHQKKNAMEFVKAGAAELVENDEATAQKVAPLLFDLLDNETLLAKMAAKAKSLARVNAAREIVNYIIKDSDLKK